MWLKSSSLPLVTQGYLINSHFPTSIFFLLFWEACSFRRNLTTCHFPSHWFISIKDADTFSDFTHSPSISSTNVSKMNIAMVFVLAQQTATWGQEGMSGDSEVMMSAYFPKPNLTKLIPHIYHIMLLCLNRSPNMQPQLRPSSKVTEVWKNAF